MKTKYSLFTDEYGASLFIYQWLPEVETVAVLQLIHGMAEHAARYDHLARYLTDRGIAVYADDHRGHGLTVPDGKSWGVLTDKAGFARMVENEREITDRIRQAHPGIPVMMLGHSMGSFIARHYVTRYGKSINGLILSGTGSQSTVELCGGLLIAFLQSLLLGKKSPAKLLDQMAFGAYNRRFAPNRTSFDWLSRDEAEVDKYVADPMCGNVFPAGFYTEFFKALLFLKRRKSIRLIPTSLPVFFFSGQEDPVGDFGKSVRRVYEKYRQHGVQKLEMHLFPDGRHEMLNEINREEVMEKLYDWINRQLKD
jgi:alpha-beta hydrolase superfamily lysophospholipase